MRIRSEAETAYRESMELKCNDQEVEDLRRFVERHAGLVRDLAFTLEKPELTKRKWQADTAESGHVFMRFRAMDTANRAVSRPPRRRRRDGDVRGIVV